MFSVPPFLRQVLLWSLLFLLGGGHHYVMQSLAWGEMLVAKARNSSWRLVAEKTFSGKEPCSMCYRAAEAREKEHQQDKPYNVESFQVKICLFTFLSEKLLTPQRKFIGCLADKNVFWVFETEAPVTPPPKLIG